MSTSLFKNSDLIKNLPTDDEELSLKEKTILDTIYPPQALKNIPQDTEKAWFHFKDIIIATILFFIINLPFSEKLLDAMAVGTIPVYWGCPEIDKFFDKNGIITFNTIEELKDIFGMAVTIGTTAKTKEEAMKFFELIGIPFKKA